METGLMLTAAAASIMLLALAVSFTGAGPRRTLAALVGGVLAAGLYIGWDMAASGTGWSRYAEGAQTAGWAAWLPAALALATAAGLIGWRMTRAWGLSGLGLFLVVFTGLGVLRDAVYGGRSLAFLFGEGVDPRLAGAAGWLSLALVTQLTIGLIAGPAKAEGPKRA